MAIIAIMGFMATVAVMVIIVIVIMNIIVYPLSPRSPRCPRFPRSALSPRSCMCVHHEHVTDVLFVCRRRAPEESCKVKPNSAKTRCVPNLGATLTTIGPKSACSGKRLVKLGLISANIAHNSDECYRGLARLGPNLPKLG